MENNLPIGVRYCGGCNPRYDRNALVGRLADFFPEQEFVPAQEGKSYSAALVVYGCPTRCANISSLTVPASGLIYLSGFEDLLPAREKLAEVLQAREVRSLNHAQVLEVLPHRSPMLLIDSVSQLRPGIEVRASFFANPELPVFQGHFPDSPVFPGVYTVEAIAQAADILMMATERYAGKIPLFAGVRQAAFRRKILPGDTLDIYVSLLEERVETSLAVCYGQVFIHGGMAADAEVRLAFR